MASKKLTEYERKRLQNIIRNNEMLAALKAKASDLTAASKRQRVATKSYKVNPQKKHKSEGPFVIRKSLRTRGMQPDSEGLRHGAIRSSSPAISFPCVVGPLSFKDAYVGSGSDRVLIDTILSVGKNLHCGDTKEELGRVKACKGQRLSEKGDLGSQITEEVGGSKICKDEDLIEKYDADSCNLIKGVINSEIDMEKSELGNSVELRLTLKPKNIAKIVQGRISELKFSPWSNVRMVVVGDEFGNVGFWNLNSEQEEGDGIYLYHVHMSPVSGIVFQQFCSSKIFTSSCSIRLMDAEKELFDLIYTSKYSIISLSQQPNNVNSLYFGEDNGRLSSLDVRIGKSSSEWRLHESRINTIDFNPQNPNIMVTSSSDATACLWDLRRMAADKPNHLKVINHKKTIQSAYFSPSGSCLATTGTDDKVGIWSGLNFTKSLMIKHSSLRHAWLSYFRAIWGWDDSYIFIGNRNRGLDVISPFQRKPNMTLKSPYISAIPHRIQAHPSEVGTLAAATRQGHVYVWTSD